ncbi:MAG: GNAT family protein [Patescibacteria group bacterium]|nr:GNAT family protein [Patescibacteria group bacterium]MDD4304290.1 GNAT family protein [Patescibacteria group bacterium]MDD4695683.1 GNAT family protein [Patescibacteria group bacterium]
MQIKGNKINLRPMKISDVDSIVENINDKLIARYTQRLPYPYFKKDAIDFIKKQKIGKDTKLNLGIQDKKSGKIIGGIGLDEINQKNKSAVLGYWLGKKYWGNKIMTEATKLIINYAFKNLKLQRIQATVMHPNIVSMKVLEKNGFKCEGILRKKILKNNKWMDIHVFGLLKNEFRK